MPLMSVMSTKKRPGVVPHADIESVFLPLWGCTQRQQQGGLETNTDETEKNTDILVMVTWRYISTLSHFQYNDTTVCDNVSRTYADDMVTTARQLINLTVMI